MRFVTSALVSLCALYVVDSIWFNGFYFFTLNQLINQIWLLGW